MGHSVHTCLIGMRLAEIADLPGDRGGLFYALLMKDLGCSSNAARVGSLFGADDLDTKREHKLTDWSRRVEAAKYAVRVTGRGRGGWRRAVTLLRLGIAASAMRGRSRRSDASAAPTSPQCSGFPRPPRRRSERSMSTGTAVAIRWDSAATPSHRSGASSVWPRPSRSSLRSGASTWPWTSRRRAAADGSTRRW